MDVLIRSVREEYVHNFLLAQLHCKSGDIPWTLQPYSFKLSTKKTVSKPKNEPSSAKGDIEHESTRDAAGHISPVT